MQESRIFYNSRDNETSFSVYGKRNFAAGATNENISMITYTGNNVIYIKDIVFSSNAVAKVELYFDATYVSGGAEVIPLNLNRGSALTSETTCYSGDTTLVATSTSANEVFDVRLNKSTFQMDFHGAIMLTKNTSLILLGEVENPGEKIRTMVYFYEADKS